MRVTCNCIEDFIENLKDASPSDVVQQVVYWATIERPIDGTMRSSVTFTIIAQASAVVCLRDGGQYHLEYGEECGVDIRDSEPEAFGSEYADKAKKKLMEYCAGCGLRIRPGSVTT